MIARTYNSAARKTLRVAALLLFLPAHLAFVVLSDLDFIPAALRENSHVRRGAAPEPQKDRLRLHVARASDFRISSVEPRPTFSPRLADPWALPVPLPPSFAADLSRRAGLTRPASLRIWLAATPDSNRAPPV